MQFSKSNLEAPPTAPGIIGQKPLEASVTHVVVTPVGVHPKPAGRHSTGKTNPPGEVAVIPETTEVPGAAAQVAARASRSSASTANVPIGDPLRLPKPFPTAENLDILRRPPTNLQA